MIEPQVLVAEQVVLVPVERAEGRFASVEDAQEVQARQ